MASISTVVTMGFGSFGDVSLLPTLGYGIGAAASPISPPCITLTQVGNPNVTLTWANPTVTLTKVGCS